MENPLPVVADLPLKPNHHIQTGFDVGVAEKDAINGNSDHPSGLDRLDSQQSDVIVSPHSLLPKPEAPRGMIDRSLSLPETPASAIGKFFREKSNSVSAAFKRISSLTNDGDEDGVVMVKEFNLVGLKVVKTLKEETKELKGRISFFSRSNCRDCTAVRSFLRERNLSYVEINVDVYPGRKKELIERTGAAAVPQIFFNEKLIGGLAALNSLRDSGMLDSKIEEILGRKCPEDAPAPPVYGFDEEGEVVIMDEMAEIVRVVRQRVPIQDRITKMKFVKNCFSGAELVEELIHHLDSSRKKAVEIGKQLARKHFIHHVFGDNEFEDGNQFYRFLEHEPLMPKCYNFRGVVNDSEPKDGGSVSRRLYCIMSAILESYASDDRLHLDYIGISNSEEFRRYVNLVEDLQRVDLTSLSHEEKLAFFLNLHNSMAIHAVVRVGHPLDKRSFFSDFMYVISGHPYSLSPINNGILRSNRRPPSTMATSALSPSIRFFRGQGIESELKNAAKEYFQRPEGVQVDLTKRIVHVPRIFKWYSGDFGEEKEIVEWMMNYLDASKAGLLRHLRNNGGSVNIAYHHYDCSLNSS